MSRLEPALLDRDRVEGQPQLAEAGSASSIEAGPGQLQSWPRAARRCPGAIAESRSRSLSTGIFPSSGGS
jgi:hypothetical protein